MENMKSVILVLALAAANLYAAAQKPADVQQAFLKSYQLESQKKYGDATGELKSIKSDDYMIYARLGWLYYLDKQYKQSVLYYEKAVSLKPYSVEARLGLVKPLAATENWDAVKSQYIAILKIDPQNTVANYWLGMIYYNSKDFDAAIRQFEKVVNLYPFDYDSVIMLAWAKLQSGNSADARILFNQALLIKPGDSSATEGLNAIK